LPNESEEVQNKKIINIIEDPGNYFKKKAKGKELLEYVNLWATSKSFKLKICEGYKSGKKGVTRNLVYREKDCYFKLVFFFQNGKKKMK